MNRSTLGNATKPAASKLPFGLENGKAGQALITYLVFADTADSRFAEIGYSLLEEINEDLSKTQDYSFGQGISGVGWLVEWLTQNSLLVNVNTDELLEDIDTAIYKLIMYTSDESISLQEGALGKIAYFTGRYLSKNIGTHRFKKLDHKECLVVLTDDLHEKILGETGILSLSKPNESDLINLGNTAVFLSLFSTLKINLTIVEAILSGIMAFAKAATVDPIALPSDRLKSILYLAGCCEMTGKTYGNTIWERYFAEVCFRLSASSLLIDCSNDNYLWTETLKSPPQTSVSFLDWRQLDKDSIPLLESPLGKKIVSQILAKNKVLLSGQLALALML